MKLKVGALSIAVIGLACLALMTSLFMLFHPIGSNVPGDGGNASALTSALALIVATIGLVLALYMQSAEYRRESEVVDGLQELRMTLSFMLARVGLLRSQGRGATNPKSLQHEKEKLLESLQGPAGRFLQYVGNIRDQRASEDSVPESWRLFNYFVADIVISDDVLQCQNSIVGLYKLVREIRTQDIDKHSKGFISSSSIDELNGFPDPTLIRAVIQISEQEQKSLRESYVISDEDIDVAVSDYRQVQTMDAGFSHGVDIDEIAKKAKSGDESYRAYIAAIWQKTKAHPLYASNPPSGAKQTD